MKTTVIDIEHQVLVRVFAGARPALGPGVEFKEGSESPTPAELQQAQCPPRPPGASGCHWQCRRASDWADTVLAVAAVTVPLVHNAGPGLAGGFPMPVMRRSGRRANPAVGAGRAGGRARPHRREGNFRHFEGDTRR